MSVVFSYSCFSCLSRIYTLIIRRQLHRPVPFWQPAIRLYFAFFVFLLWQINNVVVVVVVVVMLDPNEMMTTTTTTMFILLLIIY